MHGHHVVGTEDLNPWLSWKEETEIMKAKTSVFQSYYFPKKQIATKEGKEKSKSEASGITALDGTFYIAFVIYAVRAVSSSRIQTATSAICLVLIPGCWKTLTSYL